MADTKVADFTETTSVDGDEWLYVVKTPSGTPADRKIKANNLLIPKGCRVYNSTTQSISNATLSALAFDSERWDTDAFHSTSSNTSRITIPSGLAGKYLVGAAIEWPSNATGVRTIYLRKNGNTYHAELRFNASTNSNTTGLALCSLIDLAATDYVEAIVYQDSGSSLNVSASGSSTTQYTFEFWAIRLQQS